MNFQHILLEQRQGVAHLVLNRPDKRNALGFGPDSSRGEIVRALQQADQNPDVRVILISARGPDFCAGGDVKGLPTDPTPADDLWVIQQVDAFHEAIRAIRKPVIAAVHGRCLGAGLSFISQSDFVLAAESAQFGLPEGRFGHPGGSELAAAIGPAWAKFLIFTGEPISAAHAVRLGLVLMTLPDAELADAATDLCERIARMPADAVVLNKRAIEKATEAGGRAAGRAAGRSSDVITKAMSRRAAAPDGRPFEHIISTEGTQGLKQAMAQQYTESWLKRYHDA